MDSQEVFYRLGFALIPQIGAGRGRKLLNFFGSAQKAWKADYVDLLQAGLEDVAAKELAAGRKLLDLGKKMTEVKSFGIRLVLLEDEEYPKLLREIYNPPLLLFVRGQIIDADHYAVAIVGSRRFSEYGRQATADIVSHLAENQVTVVSGLALGIDSFAHQTVLKNPNARTIGVLGCGIDDLTIYPSENKNLVHRIIEGRGAIVSEYPPGTPPLKQHFPARNRIVSGLSQGVVVVEASSTSGSLITARHALEQGRDVFAVPGNIYHKNAAGPNSLIKLGAKLVEKPEDILEELDLRQLSNRVAVQKMIPENLDEQKILSFLEIEQLHIDRLVELSKLSINDLNPLLVTMEMKGLVRDMGGGNYIAVR
ncbi:DNA-protecting protein DprA [Candidatus Microgenomates bacterium]|nr:DNA-protecting protein DprA [Candidatus Microgenomates bacterium]